MPLKNYIEIQGMFSKIILWKSRNKVNNEICTDFLNLYILLHSCKVPANQQSIVYCMASKYGSTRNWDYLWQKFEETISPNEKLTILSALACSRNSTNLEK